MEENKLSMDLRRCMDGECEACAQYKTATFLTCQSLVQEAYRRIKYHEELEEKNRCLAPGKKVYAVNSSLGVLEYIVDKRVSTKEGTALHCSAHSEMEGDCVAALLDEREFDLRELGETFFVEPKGAEKVLGQMRGCEMLTVGG